MKIFITACLLFIQTPLYADTLHNFYKINTNKNIYFETKVRDLATIPQNSSALNSSFSSYHKKSFAEYYEQFFTPWDTSYEFQAATAQKQFSSRPMRLSESYQSYTPNFWSELELNANLQALSSLQQKAIVINNSNLRILPTNSYMFDNPNSPGEGYPFDYMQDDYLNIGEPLLISHYTKDGKFAYVLTSTGTCGFVLAKDVVEVSDKYIKQYRKGLVMLRSNSLGYLSSGVANSACIELYAGSILPLGVRKAILIPIRNAKGMADFQSINLRKGDYISKPLNFSKQNVTAMIDDLIAQPYGWGGNLFHMDCARLIRNYFAVFGIHMPLYSKEQGKKGRVLDVSAMDSLAKKQAILQYAVPYQSIIYLPGHIGVYLGQHKGEPIMLHALWGLKLFDQDNTEYRYIIGRSIISTLSPGADLLGFSQDKSNILRKITSVSNLN